MAPDDIAAWLDESSSDPREVASRYDAWAQGYDDDLASWSYRAPSTVVDLLLAHHPGASSVLDVGCGTGLVGRALRARGYTGTLRGLDLSAASLRVARAGGCYDDVEQADLQERLPCEDAAVDAALCVGVMTYLPDVEAVWRELARVVRPEGLVVVTQRDDLWVSRGCPAVVERLERDDVWTPIEVTGPSPYLPDGYGGGPAVDCYYLTARVRHDR